MGLQNLIFLNIILKGFSDYADLVLNAIIIIINNNIYSKLSSSLISL